MKEWTAAKAYFMCVTQRKGNVCEWDADKAEGFLFISMYELKFANIIEIDDNDYKMVVDELPISYEYLRPLYELMKKDGFSAISQVMSEYLCTNDSTNLEKLAESVGSELVRERHMKTKMAGLLKNKKVFLPKKDSIERIKKEINDVMLDKFFITEADMTLIILLKKCISIDSYFYYGDKDFVKNKIKEYEELEKGKKMKETFVNVRNLMLVSSSFINNVTPISE